MLARILALALLTTAFSLPSAAADSGCPAEATTLAAGGLYVANDLTVWQESNGVMGLQRAACSDDNGRDHVGDTRVL
jgi:hypothetical protein